MVGLGTRARQTPTELPRRYRSLVEARGFLIELDPVCEATATGLLSKATLSENDALHCFEDKEQPGRTFGATT